MPARPAVAILLCAFLAACAAPSALPVSPPPTPTRDPYRALLEAGDARAAVLERTAAELLYREAAALRPFEAAPCVRLALLYSDWNRPQEGLTAVAAAERLGASAAQVASLRAALYAAQGDWVKTVSYGSTALEIAPADAKTRHLLAQAHVVLGRPGQARAEYEALLDADPTDRVARERLGVLLSLYSAEGALPHLRNAGTPLASDVIAALEETVGRGPSFRLARVGQICLVHGEPALASHFLARAIAFEDSYADAHALLGQALDQLGRPDDARPHLEVAVDLASDSALTRSLLGLYYLQAGEPLAARPHLEAAYDLDPENPALSLYLAQVYADLGEYLVAEAWLQEATRLAPEEPAVWEAVVRFYLDRGMGEGGAALELAQALTQMVPESATARDLLGWAWFLSGQYEAAEDGLLQAVGLDPTLASAHFHLGQVYAAQGRTDEALAALSRAADVNTDPALRAAVEERLSGQ